MKTRINFPSSKLVQAALCGGVTVLLASCGGGADTSEPVATSATTPKLLAASYNGTAAATDLYVSTTGSDSNAGTQAAPLRSIAKAAQLAVAGTTVHVAAGSYPGGFSTTTSGTANARIHFLSDSKWGAKIVPPAGSTTSTAWDNRGSYVDIDGFDVDGSVAQGGTVWLTGIYSAGSYDGVLNNHVHHIAQATACAPGGGIGIDSYYKGVGSDVLANVVHHIGPSGCRSMYGVYISTPDSEVKNNLVYDIADAAIQLWHDATRVAVVNNTVFASNIGVLVGGGDYYNGSGPNDGTRVSNNVLYDNQYGLVEKGAVGSHNTYTNNLVFQDAVYDFLLSNGNAATATLVAAPQFVNYVRAGGGDYHLSPKSPAIGKALAADAPATDLDGMARTAGAADLGAYAYVAATGSTTGTGSGTPPIDTSGTGTGTGTGTDTGTGDTGTGTTGTGAGTGTGTTGTTTGTDPSGTDTGSSPVKILSSVRPATSHVLYVATTGSDSNPGTQSLPFKTIARAATMAQASTTVYVAPGSYPGGFKTTANGTASGRIYYVSTTKWGAKIVPPSSSSSNTAWDNRGNYIDIDGFEIDGSKPGSGTAWLHGVYTGGSYDAIRNNHVHHIATAVACTSAGGSAIGVDSYYHGVMDDVISNLVHDIGPSGCSYVQGIYVSTSGSVQSNVVYRVAEAAIHLWHDATKVTIANNTVANSGFGIIVGGGDFYFTSGPDDYTHVVNNLVYDNKYGISEQGATGSHNTYSNNLVYQNTSYNLSLRNGLAASATVATDPQFVSYTRTGTPDFHLKSSSPAVGKGTTAYAPTVDIDGYARSPMGIGAYQYH